MYLDPQQLLTHLSLKRPVEQWLGARKEGDYHVIQWLRINPQRNNSYDLCYYESFDDGNEDFLDIYEFEPYDPDFQYGKIHNFNDYEEALQASYRSYNANPNRFIGAGMIQTEYERYLMSRLKN